MQRKYILVTEKDVIQGTPNWDDSPKHGGDFCQYLKDYEKAHRYDGLKATVKEALYVIFDFAVMLLCLVTTCIFLNAISH